MCNFTFVAFVLDIKFVLLSCSIDVFEVKHIGL
jgi:hypothetical protein